MSESTITEALKAYDVTDAAIAEMEEAYMGLTVQGLDDKEGLQAVHAARMVVKGRRVQVEKTRKELKADALAYGRAVDAEAKRITALLEPIESHLREQEDAIKAERERLQREEEERRQAVIRSRCDKLAALGSQVHPVEVAAMGDAEFARVLEQETEAHKLREEKAARERAELEAEEAERKRKEAEAEAARKAEKERLAAERAELEAERAKVEAEKKRLAEDEAERKRQAEIEEAKREAAVKAEREARERAEREKREAEERAAEEERRRLLEEQTRPDREKLQHLANLVEQLNAPGLDEDLEVPVQRILDDAAARLRSLADALCPSEEVARG